MTDRELLELAAKAQLCRCGSDAMKAAEILAVLTDWQSRMQALECAMTKLRDVTFCAPESLLAEAVYGVAGGYTQIVARQIGWCEETLQDWWLTHNFGELPMGIGFSGEPLREISTIEQLAEFVAEDLRRCE